MPQASGAHIKYVWQHQPDATCNQVAAQNAWVVILPPTEDVRIYSMEFHCSVANETLEYELVIDGQTRVVTQAAVAGTGYWATMSGALWVGADTLEVQTLFFNGSHYTYVEGHSASIRMRKTTAAGASALQSLVSWARLLPT